MDLSFIVIFQYDIFMISDAQDNWLTHHQRWTGILLVLGCLLLFFPGVNGESSSVQNEPAVITLKLVDTEQYAIDRVYLMKAGEVYKDGQSRQYQNTEFSRESEEITWNPCNDISCSVVSLPTSGGKTGRDELILELFVTNPAIDVDSCYSDTTCERLKGGTCTISGMLEGFFKTGKTYEISVANLKPGIGESYPVREIL